MACSSIPCQYFLSKTLFFQSSTSTILRSPLTLSHHLTLGLPFGLFNNVGIQLVIFLFVPCSPILCIYPNHPSLFAFICRTIFCFLIILIPHYFVISIMHPGFQLGHRFSLKSIFQTLVIFVTPLLLVGFSWRFISVYIPYTYYEL